MKRNKTKQKTSLFETVLIVVAVFGIFQYLFTIGFSSTPIGERASVAEEVAISPQIEEEVVTALPEVLPIACSPKAQETRAEKKRYIVKQGDTLEQIACKFGVLPYQIRQQNKLTDNWIYPKQVLVIAKPTWKAYEGKASFYASQFHGKRRADMQIYDMHEMVVAHRHLPLCIDIRITNLKNDKSVVAAVRDRGPYVDKDHRQVDMSLGVAEAVHAVRDGVIPVRIEPLLNAVWFEKG